jgi:glutaredoxin
MYQFSCPHCSATLRVDEKHRGKKGRCKTCGKELVVPLAEEEDDDFLRGCLSDSYNTEQATQERQEKAATNSRQLERNAPPRIVVNGIGGQSITVQGSSICVRRPGKLLQHATEKMIPIRQITAVEVTERFVRLILPHSKPTDHKFTANAGLWDALLEDELAIGFTGKQDYQQALRLQRYVAEYSEKPAAVVPQQRSMAEQLRDLKGLLDDGLITDAEFQAKKAQILGL